MNLKRRGMELDTRCVVYNHFDENGAHVFFKCKMMDKVWDHLGMVGRWICWQGTHLLERLSRQS
jgi:hypothetical protein